MQRIEKLLNAFVEASKKILEDNLAGIYLHGSASMGCFCYEIAARFASPEQIFHASSKMLTNGFTSLRIGF